MNNENFEEMNNQNDIAGNNKEGKANKNNLQIFDFANKQVRTVFKNGQVWWVLKDVCNVLNITNPRKAAQRLNENEKGVTQGYTPGGLQKMVIINEPGLYKIIFRSDKPEAQKFADWVYCEVLPSIRKHGAYIIPDKIAEYIDNPEKIKELFEEVQEKRQDVIAEQRENYLLRLENNDLKHKIDTDRNKVWFAEMHLASDYNVTIGDFAKILRQAGYATGQNRLYEWLRIKGYIALKMTGGTPTQEAINKGILTTNHDATISRNNKPYISKTIFITPKGQQYIAQQYREYAEKCKKEEEQLEMGF